MHVHAAWKRFYCYYKWQVYWHHSPTQVSVQCGKQPGYGSSSVSANYFFRTFNCCAKITAPKMWKLKETVMWLFLPSFLCFCFVFHVPGETVSFIGLNSRVTSVYRTRKLIFYRFILSFLLTIKSNELKMLLFSWCFSKLVFSCWVESSNITRKRLIFGIRGHEY